MGNCSMTQYLADIKIKIDLIVMSGSKINTGDMIFYMLNGLSQSYQSFKIAIQTNLQSLNLDDLYSLLYNEETIQIVESNR